MVTNIRYAISDILYNLQSLSFLFCFVHDACSFIHFQFIDFYIPFFCSGLQLSLSFLFSHYLSLYIFFSCLIYSSFYLCPQTLLLGFYLSSLLLPSRFRSSVPVPLYPTDSLSFTFVSCIFCSHLSFFCLPHSFVNAFSSLYRSVIWLTTPAFTWSTVAHCKCTDCYNRIISGLNQTAK